MAFGIQRNTPLNGCLVSCPADWLIRLGCTLLEQGATSKEKLHEALEAQGEDTDPIVVEILIKIWERFDDENFQRMLNPLQSGI